MSTSTSMPALAALALSVLATPALAEDGKTMPGSACQPSDDSRPINFFRGLGTLVNLDPTPETVNCPVVKDLNKIKRAVVMLVDRNPNPDADILCTLYTLRGDGTIQTFSSKRTKDSFTLALPSNFGTQGATTDGAYDLTCILPPYHPTFGGSAIVKYTIVED